jgi:3'-phosphoadenosine 5'-phosphosulfate sulfotransferase (PAPS reductase)/FAD synthetase
VGSSHKTVRDRAQVESFPGMPDKLRSIPPKAREYAALTLDEAIARSHALLDEVLAGATFFDFVLDEDGEKIYDSDTNQPYVVERKLRAPDPDKVFTLFSGGGDSSILAHLMRKRVGGLVHVDTGIAVPATRGYVEAVAAEWNMALRIAQPDDRYDDLVLGKVKAKTKDRAVWEGFPGPAGHYMMYVRLKERALDALRRDLVGRRGRTGQIVFLGGMRWGESDRRFRNAEELDRAGAIIWCSPIVYWTDSHVAEYRSRYLCNDLHQHADHRLCRPDSLPMSEVTENLHMSGDCLCGAFAKPGELDEVSFFYPEVGERLRALQEQAEAAGIKRCVWGAGRERAEKVREPGRLCSSCVEIPGQGDLIEQWRDAGLLSDDQAVALAGRN